MTTWGWIYVQHREVLKLICYDRSWDHRIRRWDFYSCRLTEKRHHCSSSPQCGHNRFEWAITSSQIELLPPLQTQGSRKNSRQRCTTSPRRHNHIFTKLWKFRWPSLTTVKSASRIQPIPRGPWCINGQSAVVIHLDIFHYKSLRNRGVLQWICPHGFSMMVEGFI